jgi:glyoxylase-like metal-dependent hydrolase (beta-lactamase superfamily II)
MAELTRRRVIAGATALTATALAPATIPAPARAAIPQTGKQAPSFYRHKVGDYEITVVTDGVRRFPLPDNFVDNAKKEDVNAALEAAYLPKDQMALFYNPLVVNTGSKLIVIDTGGGPVAYAQSKGDIGQFMTNFIAAGFDPKAVDTVIISHFHLDHINGLITADDKPAFPNAEVMVPAIEWAWVMDDANMAKGRPLDKTALFEPARKVFGIIKDPKRYEWGKEIAPGITTLGTPGHTPGHTSFTIASGSAQLFHQVDITNNQHLYVRNPDWHFLYDIDPALAVQTRRKVYDMVSAEKARISGFHWSFPSVGHVEKDGNGYRMVPEVWNPVI